MKNTKVGKHSTVRRRLSTEPVKPWTRAELRALERSARRNADLLLAADLEDARHVQADLEAAGAAAEAWGLLDEREKNNR